MTLKETLNKLSNYKLGTYIKAVFKSNNANGTKISNCVVRLTNKSIKTNKQGVDYLTMRITNNPRHKVETTYFNNNGEFITKIDYMLGQKEKTPVEDFFSKHLCDIISLG